MNHDQFTYWLQGFVEMNGGKEPTKAQWKMIKDHLKLCFNKVTPSYTQLEPYRNPIQPPFRVTCTSGVNEIMPDGKVITRGYGGGGGYKRNGGGGAC
jgi:hypothetical protein